MAGISNQLMNIYILILLAVFCATGTGAIIYVDDDADGLNNGLNWSNAYKCLQDALFEASFSSEFVEIRIAQGIYTPDRGAGIMLGDRDATFPLFNGVRLIGGYAGVGPAHRCGKLGF